MTTAKSEARAIPSTGPQMKLQGRTAIVRIDGIVERDAIEACDYMLWRAGDQISGAVLDLSLASHIDYRAPVVLVARRRVLKARGGELAVVAARSDVRLIIRATAGSEIPVFPTKEEALAYVNGEPDSVVALAAKQKSRKR